MPAARGARLRRGDLHLLLMETPPRTVHTPKTGFTQDPCWVSAATERGGGGRESGGSCSGGPGGAEEGLL